MFHHTPSIAATIPQSTSSSPREPPPEDSLDIERILDEKRVRIDEEIEQFRAKKHQEFRNFENGLRQKIGSEKRRRGGPSPTRSPTLARKSLLGLLTGGRQAGRTTSNEENDTRNDSIRNSAIAQYAHNQASPHSQSFHALSEQGYQVNKPSLASVYEERVISPNATNSSALEESPPILSPHRKHPDEHVQPVEFDDQNSSASDELSPTSLTSVSTSPELSTSSASEFLPQNISSSSPTSQLQQRELTDFSALNYLHLLESKHSSLPRSSIDHLHTTSDHIREHSRSSHQSSTSLPSAFRRRSSSISRRPKHVLFKLADTAIVEPSSSYEERPSMSSPRNQASPIAERLQKEIEAGYSSSSSAKSPVNTQRHAAKPDRGHDTKDDVGEEMFFLDEEVDQDSAKAKAGDKEKDSQSDSNHRRGNEEELTVGSPAAGSLPINIVKRR